MPGRRWSTWAMTYWRRWCQGARSTPRASACRSSRRAARYGARWRATSSGAALSCARCGLDRAAGPAQGADGGRAGPARRAKPVRITLDLSPELYRELTLWTDSAAISLGVPRVSLADAVRAMIRVAAENPDQVLDRLRRDRDR